MATKKAGGSTSLYSKPQPKYRAVKKFGDEEIRKGQIIVTQLGNKFWPGNYTQQGRNYTIFAIADGKVQFKVGFKNRTYVNVIPHDL